MGRRAMDFRNVLVSCQPSPMVSRER